MDIELLIRKGILGYYESCEITEIFLFNKKDNSVKNFYTIGVFEEKPYNGFNKEFLEERIPISRYEFIGIQRYWYSVEEIKTHLNLLKDKNLWSVGDKTVLQSSQLKYLPKQYVPSDEGNRINNILKNNYHNGSYIIEFFDENKSNIDFLLKIESLNKLNEICQKIKRTVPIDLSIARDRIGNFIFQFPITLVNISHSALATWKGIEMQFKWHGLSQNNWPDCLIQVEATLDKHYMGAVIEDYNKLSSQEIVFDNLDQTTSIKVWRQNPSLILYTYSGTYVREFNFNMGLINHEPRVFEVDGEVKKVEIVAEGMGNNKIFPKRYTDFINNNLYDDEKKQLEKRLSFKQYNQSTYDELEDLRKLITLNDKNGVYLWDPYLSPKDILRTLFFSKTAGTVLRAVGSLNSNVRNIYERGDETIEDIILDYNNTLENASHNHQGLNLEFRIQHGNYGGSFHDRFLIFPSTQFERAKVYSLGTSLNSYGNKHHILQIVSHPQPVVDAFNELWEKLNNDKCLVWKKPT